MTEFNDLAIIGEIVAGEAAQTRAQLEELINKSSKSSFDIGELLYKIKQKGFYYPFNTFAEYEKTLTELKPRKRQYLRRIAEVMSEVGIERTVYESLGLSKVREITSLDPAGTWLNPETQVEIPIKEFIVGLVEQGKSMSLDTIKGHVRVLKGQVGSEDIVFLKFAVTRGTADNVIKPALELAKANVGSVAKDDEGISKDASDSRALELISAEYLADPANSYLNLNGKEIPESEQSY